MINHLVTYLIGTHQEMLNSEREEGLNKDIQSAMEKCNWEESAG